MYFLSGSAFYRNTKKRYLSNIAVVRACWSAIICKYKYSLCVFCVFSVCVFCLCFHAVFSLCVFSSLCFFLSSLCFQYVLSVCVFCPCFLSGFAFLSINFDIILLWSGLADQLLFADINSQLIWLQYKYKILTRYFGLSGSPASSCFFFALTKAMPLVCWACGLLPGSQHNVHLGDGEGRCQWSPRNCVET